MSKIDICIYKKIRVEQLASMLEEQFGGWAGGLHMEAACAFMAAKMATERGYTSLKEIWKDEDFWGILWS